MRKPTSANIGQKWGTRQNYADYSVIHVPGKFQIYFE